MKFSVEVDCTPEEARGFLGLPDVAALQAPVMAVLEQRLTEAVRATDPKVLLEQWLPMGFKALEQLPALWAQLGAQAMRHPAQPPAKPPKPGEP